MSTRRTIAEIKAEIVETYQSNDKVRMAYGLASGESLNLSKVSIENAIFYAMAVCIYTFEGVLQTWLSLVDETIENDKPHTCNWYASQAKGYQHGFSFDEDSWDWDNGDATDDEIEASKIVKFAAVVEEGVQVILKVAGEGPQPLTDTQLAGLESYMKRIKDAGVYLQYRNETPDSLRATITIWYNPMIMDSDGTNITTGNEEVRDAVTEFIQDIPFNGEFHVDKLEDTLQAVDGVEVVSINSIQSISNNTKPQGYHDIEGYEQPWSGYYTIEDSSDLIIQYKPYNADDDD